jgi:CelD/BcsL family acetyltransferase involved in cellulose biosynthesis
MRRARRRAEALGAVEIALLAPGADEVAELLDEALAVEARGWKGRAGTAVVLDERRRPFVAAYAARAAAAGALRLALLRIDGRAMAMQFAVEYDRRLWLLKIGFDEEASRCSPGSLLLLAALRDAATRGLRACEFLGEVESWTRAWTTCERSIVAVRGYPARPRTVLRLGGVVRQRLRPSEATA